MRRYLPDRARTASRADELAHPDARDRIGVSVAGARRDGPGVVLARKVPVARVRADGPLRPRVEACATAMTGPGAHVPLGVLAGAVALATVLGDGALVRGTGDRAHATVLSDAALVVLARVGALAGVLGDPARISKTGG